MNEEEKSAGVESVREIIQRNISKAEEILKLAGGIEIDIIGIPEGKDQSEYKEAENIYEELIYERAILLESISILQELKKQFAQESGVK